MKRALTALAALLCFAAAPAAFSADSAPFSKSVTVEGDIIRLGDLFPNAGDKADVRVAQAPALGRQAVYDARWLQALANLNGIAWSPKSERDYLVIERANRVINRENVEDSIRRKLAEKKPDGDFSVVFDNDRQKLYAAPESTESPQLANLELDESSNRFTATLQVPGQAEPQRVTGKIQETVRVPVLARQVKPGETIGEKDIEWITMRQRMIGSDVLQNERDIIGQSPKRWKKTGEPLRANDLTPPSLVKKGEAVLMVFQSGNMSLTAKGRALEDGAMGGSIRIQNTHSNRIIDATVVDAGTVSVSPSSSVSGLSAGTPKQQALNR